MKNTIPIALATANIRFTFTLSSYRITVSPFNSSIKIARTLLTANQRIKSKSICRASIAVGSNSKWRTQTLSSCCITLLGGQAVALFAIGEAPEAGSTFLK